MSPKRSSKGQIGLIVILIMAVGLTIGLAIASQSLTDISVSETEEKSLRAFNAAEAGIEEILRQSTITAGSTTVPVGDLTAAVSVVEKKSQQLILGSNETMEVPLQGATTSQVKISWVNIGDSTQNPGTCTEGEGDAPASLEILRLRNQAGQILPYRYLYNACDALNGINGFANTLADAPALQDGTVPFLKQVTFTNIDGDSGDGTYDIALRIRTFYNQATVAVTDPTGSDGLPLQEYKVTSIGTAPTGEKRTVEVTRSVEAWPPIFDYVLFSGSQLAK